MTEKREGRREEGARGSEDEMGEERNKTLVCY